MGNTSRNKTFGNDWSIFDAFHSELLIDNFQITINSQLILSIHIHIFEGLFIGIVFKWSTNGLVSMLNSALEKRQWNTRFGGAHPRLETSETIGQPALRHLHVIYSRATEYICLDYLWNKPVPIPSCCPFDATASWSTDSWKADKWP